ncbi:MAG: type II toxin-antitoxin system RelE/ParE family toxin [Armatimonadetes bacterium]|nr:type II toxin-antitoxin system RelE/ParE family toxin [Armatimonadota bacterium]
MPFAVRLTPAARRQFLALPRSVQDRLRPLLDTLAENPTPAPPLGRKLVGRDDTYRLAEGPYRVVYEVDRREATVLVLWIGNRRDAYRRR